MRITRLITGALGTIGTAAVATGLIVGLAWPPTAQAVAEPNAGSDAALGVVSTTAVPVAAAAEATDKFGAKPGSGASSAKQKTIKATPVVKKKAKKVRRKPKVRKLRYGPVMTARVSWYGPGFYGNTMAGGGRLTPSSVVVAHRSLPFGTRIRFTYRGKSVIAVVRDRGPYISGRTFDLGPGTARRLGFSGVGTVRYRIVKR